MAKSTEIEPSVASVLNINIPVYEMSSNTDHSQFVELPLPLGEFVEAHEFEQRCVHGLLNLAETFDINRVFKVLSVPKEHQTNVQSCTIK